MLFKQEEFENADFVGVDEKHSKTELYKSNGVKTVKWFPCPSFQTQSKMTFNNVFKFSWRCAEGA